MCLSTVYEVCDNNEKLVCQYASGISAKEDTVYITNITGEECEVKGTIKNIDLVKNIILVESSK